MRRINGYLDLNKYYYKLVGSKKPKVLEKNGYLTVSPYCKYHYYLDIDGEIYYFKDSNFGYREVLSYLIAQDLGVNSVFYDMAMFGDDKGVISKNYHEFSYYYFTADDLLSEYMQKEKAFVEELMGSSIPSKYHVDDYFSLELVWLALESKYPNNKDDIKRIMIELADQYMFKLLTGGSDAASHNVEFGYNGKKLTLCPCYDNEYSLWPEHDDFLMTAETGISKDYIDNLKNFLSVSSREFVERFLEMYSHFDNDYMCDIINKLEKSHDFTLPDEDKERILVFYDKIKNVVDSVLEELGIENSRRKNG